MASTFGFSISLAEKTAFAISVPRFNDLISFKSANHINRYFRHKDIKLTKRTMYHEREYDSETIGRLSKVLYLVTKILYDEYYCSTNILFIVFVQKPGKNWKRLTKFRHGVENLFRLRMLSNDCLYLIRYDDQTGKYFEIKYTKSFYNLPHLT